MPPVTELFESVLQTYMSSPDAGTSRAVHAGQVYGSKAYNLYDWQDVAYFVAPQEVVGDLTFIVVVEARIFPATKYPDARVGYFIENTRKNDGSKYRSEVKHFNKRQHFFVMQVSAVVNDLLDRAIDLGNFLYESFEKQTFAQGLKQAKEQASPAAVAVGVAGSTQASFAAFAAKASGTKRLASEADLTTKPASPWAALAAQHARSAQQAGHIEL